MNILGISAFYHDSSCCLLSHGKLLAAAAEERFSRVKHDAGLPSQAFRYCLQKGKLDISDIDCLAYYEMPAKKLERQTWQGKATLFAKDIAFPDPGSVAQTLREGLGYEGPILFFEHHRAHAASAFYYSGFEAAAIMTVDGVGEWATTAYGLGSHDAMDLFEEVRFPHSLGLFYAAITAYLGFRVNDGEYKVMGLAPYGKPLFTKEIRRLIESGAGGQFELKLPYFDFISGKTMYSALFSELLGQPPRIPGTELSDFHKAVAKSTQLVLEEILLEKTSWLSSQVDSNNLCMAGGVALNCVANGRIIRETPFKRLFVQPAAGDGGACLGAAALAHVQLNGKRHSTEAMNHVFLGPDFSENEIRHLLESAGLAYIDYSKNEETLLDEVADRLAQHKVIGWFQGAMEFGPRALGARSILANPMDDDVRERLNELVKKRESFRPFAPSVLLEQAAKHFDLDHAAPFMLETCQVKSSLHLPGITHVDDSARPQTVNAQANPRFAALLEAFYRRTGCPILVNTSFNVKDEPIVCTPVDALFCMINAQLDCLVLGSFLLDKACLPANLSKLTAQWRQIPRRISSKTKGPLEENLYSFV